jgi:hypothetical protein
MIKRIVTVSLRVEFLLLLAAAWVLALPVAKEAHADEGSCVDTCSNAFGTTFTRNGRFYILADCGSSELGTGTTWCMYVGRAL